MFFLPIGDTPNPQNFKPWVNWGLIAANVLVYVLVTFPLSGQAVDPADPAVAAYLELLLPALPADIPAEYVLDSISAYDLFTLEHGYVPAAPSVADLFSAMFLHGGFGHLAGNMLFLWIYGDNVEHRLGRLPYLVAYLLTGAAATLSFAALASGTTTPLVGASGAISGVLGFYFLLFPRNQVKVFFAFFVFIIRVFLVPSRIVLGLYVVFDNLLPFLGGGGGNVAHGAHLGGFFAGLGLAWVGERLDWRMPGGGARADPAPKAPEDSAAFAVAAEGALAAGEDAEAVALIRRGLSLARSRREEARLLLVLGLVRLRRGQAASAYQNLKVALERDPDPQTEARIREALGGIAR